MKLKSLSNNAVRYGCILISILVLAGCAKKFLYSNIDWVVIEYLDDYVSLDGEQEALLEERILLLADWHKEEELPLYIDHLKQLESLNKDNVTLESLQANRDQMRDHYQRLVSKAAPDLFSLSMQLDSKQESEFVDSVKERYKERDEKYAGKTEQELREIVLENTEEWMEEWLGKLSSKQKARAKQLSQDVIINSPLWRDYRSSIIQELEYLFENKNNSVVYQQVFMQLLFEPESYYSDQLTKNIDHNIALTDQFTLDISQTMSDKQWRHFHGKIREWRELAEDLLN
ncbi:conserved hypothetical protein [Vibrio owensii]|uniref:DUF6279 family lipoprotein n=1 Tax=Vibrio TaxID=662 RepID=UPI000EFC6315|nr:MULTISPECIES: DUF6279 family lipoprotein [Vibrio]AYO22732.1 hypothetical protein D0856_22570 [Vibrio owensii]CAD7823944.1 hypothetical protein ACOMICROBIO_NCLOACGD_04403 [Vibrio sp. B1ASS3]CAE6951933.1 hypothetical protein ACOMICROBIO_NCLOACGD_04403 [Vibrio sp. B1ASS3]CAH1540707.1 conserved hypothetical protein [Vibrio owensii]CAH1592941.1 conserved hypothetical protein [Vibrio owensii]